MPQSIHLTLHQRVVSLLQSNLPTQQLLIKLREAFSLNRTELATLSGIPPRRICYLETSTQSRGPTSDEEQSLRTVYDIPFPFCNSIGRCYATTLLKKHAMANHIPLPP